MWAKPPRWEPPEGVATTPTEPKDVPSGYQPPLIGASSANRQSSLPPTVEQKPTVAPARKVIISSRIASVTEANKSLDFVSNLRRALPTDYAMVHGCGGEGHAPNSTIRLDLRDYPDGAGGISKIVKFWIDAGDIAILQHAALNASCGMLPPGFSYVREKNDPSKGETIKVAIRYRPYLDDNKVNSHPWSIEIENSRAAAPIQASGNLPCTPEAGFRNFACIDVSSDKFAAALVAVERFIRLWEYRQVPMIDEICTKEEYARQQRRAQQMEVTK